MEATCKFKEEHGKCRKRVAFLEDGLPYVADRAPTGEAVGFALSALEDAASVADPATHLVVVRQGKFLGFRAVRREAAAGEAPRQGAAVLLQPEPRRERAVGDAG